MFSPSSEETRRGYEKADSKSPMFYSYSMYNINANSLPVSTLLEILTIGYPIVVGLFVTLISTLNSNVKKNSQFRTKIAPTITLVLIVYGTAVATLLGTHIGPADSLTCSLDERWLHLFRNKDENTIRRIQAQFQCCGLHSVRDKAWPFPSRGVSNDACANSFNRSKSCFGDWRAEEQKSAGLALLVVILTVAWKVRSIPLI